MKKILKPVIVTIIILAGLTAGAYFLLTGKKEEASEFNERRYNDQSDQIDSHAYRSEMPSLAVPLNTSGDEKNVYNFNDSNVFSVSNSESAIERLDRLKRRMDASFDKPIIAYNPFGTMPNTYYFYFKTPTKCMVRYTVTVEDEKITDHIRYVLNGEVKNMTGEHEFIIEGLIPGMKNFIKMELIGDDGSHREDITYQIEIPNEMLPSKFTYEPGRSELRLQNGMFYLMPKTDKQIYIYDNNGVLRGTMATESAHGKRIYKTEGGLIYQVSPNKVVRINRLSAVTGVATVSGYGNILDFAYDGFDNIISLVKKGKSYYLVRSSMEKGGTTEVFKFDKKIHPTSISQVVGGRVYISSDKPMGIMRIKGLMSKSPQIDLVIGQKSDWKKTSLKKKVFDPTKPKKKKTEDADAEAASGEAATAEPKEDKDPALKGWDMTDSELFLAEDESNGASDVLTFAVVKDRLVRAIKMQVSGKKFKDTTTTLLLDKETEAEGKVVVQWGERGSCIVANGTRGMYEERDEIFKTTRTFNTIGGFDGIRKLNMEGFFFYG